MEYLGKGEREALTYNGQKESLLYEVRMKTAGTHVYVNYTLFHVANKARVNVGFGFGVNKSKYTKNQLTTTNTSSGQEKIYDSYLDYAPVWTDLPVRLGFVFNDHFQLNVSSRLLDSFANFVGTKADNKITSFTVNYVL